MAALSIRQPLYSLLLHPEVYGGYVKATTNTARSKQKVMKWRKPTKKIGRVRPPNRKWHRIMTNMLHAPWTFRLHNTEKYSDENEDEGDWPAGECVWSKIQSQAKREDYIANQSARIDNVFIPTMATTNSISARKWSMLEVTQ